MNDYVIMPSSDYKNACDTIRSATGRTNLIKSGDLSTEIAGVIGNKIEDNLRYFQCNIDPIERTVVLYDIRYDLIYTDTGSYDVTIPDTLCGFQVFISA